MSWASLVCAENLSFHRYRFFLEFQVPSIRDADFGLEPNQFCSHFGYNTVTTVSISTHLYYRLYMYLSMYVVGENLALSWPM